MGTPSWRPFCGTWFPKWKPSGAKQRHLEAFQRCAVSETMSQPRVPLGGEWWHRWRHSTDLMPHASCCSHSLWQTLVPQNYNGFPRIVEGETSHTRVCHPCASATCSEVGFLLTYLWCCISTSSLTYLISTFLFSLKMKSLNGLNM